MKKACIICDIDGVYTDSREWNKHIPENVKDREGWVNFLKQNKLCKPNKPIILVLKMLSKVFPILFVTSRENYGNMRKITKEQIRNFSNGTINVGPLSRHKLLMREANDFREAHIVKEEILKRDILPYYYPLMAIDDEPSNVEMFRRNSVFTKHYTDLRKGE